MKLKFSLYNNIINNNNQILKKFFEHKIVRQSLLI